MEAKLRAAVPENPWASVPTPYQPWAERQLELRMKQALTVLGPEPSAADMAVATNAVPTVVAKIGEIAAECTDRDCLYKHAESPSLLRRLHSALCPGTWPFC